MRKFARQAAILADLALAVSGCAQQGTDGAKLAEQCPETRFVIDHCGNVDPKVFDRSQSDDKPSHSVEDWKRSMDQLAALPNVVCKISGLVARAPLTWDAGTLAPAGSA